MCEWCQHDELDNALRTDYCAQLLLERDRKRQLTNQGPRSRGTKNNTLKHTHTHTPTNLPNTLRMNERMNESSVPGDPGNQWLSAPCGGEKKQTTCTHTRAHRGGERERERGETSQKRNKKKKRRLRTTPHASSHMIGPNISEIRKKRKSHAFAHDRTQIAG